ncbi:MAG: patatin-like phospholipase family protein [Pseudomonadota bacterium]
MKFAKYVIGLTLAVSTGACASLEPRNPVPAALVEEAVVPGFETVRQWGDYNDPADVRRQMLNRAERLKARFGPEAETGETPKLTYLALSGGGQYGAFSAGALTAWTKTGTRPEFDGVTGISTGSIIAPFAFLGEKYDPVLEEIYTTFSTDDMLEPQILSGLLGGSSVADTGPLREKIAAYVTREFLEEVAVEHRKGRLLFVGTTNLDVGRSVIWNMGAIAASGQPGALELFRKIILASAAIPIAFPPVFFDVEAEGGRYEELHVDGGVTTQVNILSPQIPSYLMDDLVGFHVERELFVLVNGAVIPLREPVSPRIHKIGGASINALWYAQAVGDLYKIHAVAERDNVTANYGWIPASFAEVPGEQFDPAFMRKLFDLGGDLLTTGEMWRRVPPNFSTREEGVALPEEAPDPEKLEELAAAE